MNLWLPACVIFDRIMIQANVYTQASYSDTQEKTYEEHRKRACIYERQVYRL